MSQGEGLELADLLVKDHVTLEELFETGIKVAGSIKRRDEAEDVIFNFDKIAKGFPTENKAQTRRGIAEWMIGNYERMIEILEETKASLEKFFFLGVAYFDLGKYTKALENLEAAYEAQPDSPLILQYKAETEIKLGKTEEGLKSIERLYKITSETPDYLYLRGLYYDYLGDHPEAMEMYENALRIDPAHVKSMFRQAYNLYLRGEDKTALELYEQLRNLSPLHVNTLINLGILYEDMGEYKKAKECFEHVLEYYPWHTRARLYLDDNEASINMYYDEQELQRQERLRMILSTPLDETDISDKVKEILATLNLKTVGDLVHKTEEELSELPGLGKGALGEIKETLRVRGLNLAIDKETPGIPTEPPPEGVNPEVLNIPISDLEWTSRIKKVFERLEIYTLGDLIKKSKKDLMGNRNLGHTSIREIENKLSAFNLSLRQD